MEKLGGQKQLSTRISEGLWKDLEDARQTRGWSIPELLAAMIDRWNRPVSQDRSSGAAAPVDAFARAAILRRPVVTAEQFAKYQEFCAHMGRAAPTLEEYQDELVSMAVDAGQPALRPDEGYLDQMIAKSQPNPMHGKIRKASMDQLQALQSGKIEGAVKSADDVREELRLLTTGERRGTVRPAESAAPPARPIEPPGDEMPPDDSLGEIF